MAFTLVTVSGTFLVTDDLTPARGEITFRLSQSMQDTSLNQIVSADRRSVRLDATGSFSIVLPATDDTSTQPTGVTYEVEELIEDQAPRRYAIALPKANTNVNLADIAPAVPGPAMFQYSLVGHTHPPGGGINLDDLDDVDLPTPTDGDVVTWDAAQSLWVNEPVAAASHPNLAAHDALGLATDTEVTSAVSAHAAAGDPHPTYETSAEAAAKVTAHEGAADPHGVYVLESSFDAKGDLLLGTADNTFTRVPVGSDGQVLTAASGQPSGVQWATPASGVTDHGLLTGLADDDHPQYHTAAEVAADIATHVGLADPHPGYVLESLFDANTVLAANVDNTPLALTMGASTMLARLAAGNIVSATPAQIRTLLDVPLNAEAILDVLFDAKGDLIGATAADTPARLAVGADGTVLTAASGQATGLQWVAPIVYAPSTVDYLVGSASAGLSAEIVVGTAPNGELGGTWAAITVDASHSGSTHAATQAAAEATAAAALAAHVAAADPHTGYQKESEKGAASGYASLGADTLVPQDQLGTGVQDGTKFLRDDGTWQAVPAGYTDEQAQDAVGTILLDSASIDFTYVDATPSLTAVVLPAGVDHNSLANLTTGDPHTQYPLKSLFDAKGDLLGATADNTPARVAVGTDGQLLSADSAQGTGLAWVTHGATGDPHTQYATDTDLTNHVAAADPHAGYVLESLLDAKGDLYAASAADTPARVAVGTNGQFLIAASAQASGLLWATLDHGANNGQATAGLADDDHTQYVLLAGRSGGQTWIGGTGSGDDAHIQSTSHATRGTLFLDDEVSVRNATATFTSAPRWLVSDGTYTLDFASATFGNLLHFSGTALFNQSGAAAGAGALVANSGTWKNVNGVAANLGSMFLFNNLGTYQADAAAISLTTYATVNDAPVFNIINAGTLAVTSHHALRSIPNVGTGTTLTNRNGLIFFDALGAGTVTNQIALNVQDLTRGGTLNASVVSAGAAVQMRHAGPAHFGANAAPATNCIVQITQPTVGNLVQRLVSTATNDDPTEDVYHARVATTDATVTNLFTYAIPASTTVEIYAFVVARRTGGSAGTAEDSGGWRRIGVFKNVAGTATQTGTTSAAGVDNEDQAGWDVTMDVASANARVRVTGATNNNITWHATIRVYQVGS